MIIELVFLGETLVFAHQRNGKQIQNTCHHTKRHLINRAHVVIYCALWRNRNYGVANNKFTTRNRTITHVIPPRLEICWIIWLKKKQSFVVGMIIIVLISLQNDKQIQIVIRMPSIRFPLVYAVKFGARTGITIVYKLIQYFSTLICTNWTWQIAEIILHTFSTNHSVKT